MKFDPCNESYAHEVHSSEGFPTRKLSLYMHLLVAIDCEFGTHVALSLLMTGEIFEQYSAL